MRYEFVAEPPAGVVPVEDPEQLAEARAFYAAVGAQLALPDETLAVEWSLPIEDVAEARAVWQAFVDDFGPTAERQICIRRRVAFTGVASLATPRGS